MQTPEDFFRWLVIFFVRPQQQSKPLFVSRLIDKEKIGKAVARIALAVAFSILPVSLSSADQPREQDFNIPQQSVKSALNSLATQANVFLLFPYDQVIEVNANPVVGVYSIQQALDLLLKNTGLNGDLTQGGVLAISRAGTNASATANNGKGKSMNTSKRKNVLATMVGLFATAGGVGSALGQGDEAATAQGGIDEIIVTANKREQSLQDTAMSISALTGEDIAKKGIVGMGDYLSSIPGVSQADYGVSRNRLTMRGISASSADETTVGIFLGEVSLTNIGEYGTAVDAKLVDIERIEILRGPQGTLFGSGSMSGAVRNIPNTPKLAKLEGELQIGGSSTDGAGGLNDKLVGIINLPLVHDKLALRIASYRFQNKGYVDMVGPSNTSSTVAAAETLGGVLNTRQAVGDTEFIGARASLLWKPNERMSATLSHVTQDLDQDGIILISEDGYEGSAIDLSSRFGRHEGRRDETDYTNLVVDVDLGWGDIILSSTVSEGEYGRLQAIDRFLPFPVGIENDYDTKGVTQELRISSRLAGPFQFLGGMYYENLENIQLISAQWTGDDDSLNFFGTPQLLNANWEDHIQQQAFFGEISYEMTEKLKLTLGGRWFDYDRRFVNTGTGPFAPAPVDEESDEDSFKGKANLTYIPDDDMLFYVQWAQGFRLGRPVAIPPRNICDTDDDGILDGTTVPISIGPLESDNLDSVELGGKFALMDNRLVINTAIYDIDWEGIPVLVTGSCGASTTINAGQAKSQGLEIETNFYISDVLRFDFGFSYVDAELKEDAPGLGFKGERLPYTPRSSVSVGVDYRFDLRGYSSYIHTNYSYVGGSHIDLSESSEQMGDYGKINLRLGVSINEQVNIELYSTNLTKNDEYTFVDIDGFHRLTPRQFGLDISFLF